ncbi:MAG: ABC transporter ATP-binding protein [bacterium]|nr:ABC transporter ATP-binding protein [bacterium]
MEARGLTRRFGDLTAVDGLDLDVFRGEVFGFLGPNGAGKSTSIRMLVGLLTPSEGVARVLGCTMPEEVEELRSRVGYMTQKFSLYDDLSVAENLEFAAEIFGLDRDRRRLRIEEVIAEYGLGPRRGQRPATLSGGWKQRLALAVATVHEPELLFLDEPTAGVDPDSRRLFWEKLFQLAAAGTTILVSTHYMDEAIRCHRLCVVRDGRRAALGRPVDLTRALEGRIIEMWARPAHRLMAALAGRQEVMSATQLGSRVHALLAPGAPPAEELVARLVPQLESEGLKRVGGVVADPNLEDVMVALTRGEELALGEKT